ncbi:MAG: YeeE/YedE thiosulfate transporter family protein, partial [Bacteroidota bacterium]|nr:YeeE/YedE thiosulfate transporter family protein [Bacteroidota bacterium]
FYGYDFVVLRVFFTAAITAMTGMIFFHYFGWIDLELIYVNPTFVTSAIVGGVIMGLGFIIGGFCPGTSMCGLAIGRIDAMVFFAGIFLGIFIFGESYSLFEELMYAANLGNVKVFDSLGISQGLFALLLIVVALAAFYVTARIEKNVTKVDY